MSSFFCSSPCTFSPVPANPPSSSASQQPHRRTRHSRHVLDTGLSDHICDGSSVGSASSHAQAHRSPACRLDAREDRLKVAHGLVPT
eukprot:748352-Hanusia_phi.AAC.1